MSAGDFVDNLWNMFDRKVEVTSGIISSVADLFEECDKRGDLLQAWQDLRIEVSLQHLIALLPPFVQCLPFVFPFLPLAKPIPFASTDCSSS